MKLVDDIQDRFTARLVYGDPIERDGLIVVPAIRVAGGGGGGSGTDAGNGEGEGGGFGLRARPAGAWVFKDAAVRWKPAIDVNAIIVGSQLLAVVYVLSTRLSRRARQRD